MDSNLPNQVVEKRVVLKTWLRIVLALLAGFLAFYCIAYFKDWQFRKGLDESRQAYDEWQEDFYQSALADNVGGKTPQDTLRMYIEAVEKGDYELASKYFILEKQEKELKIFQDKKYKQEDLDNYIGLLKKVLAEETGGYSWDKKFFSYDGKILVDLALYPSGVWKLVEI
jgi:hypothetical protein